MLEPRDNVFHLALQAPAVPGSPDAAPKGPSDERAISPVISLLPALLAGLAIWAVIAALIVLATMVF